MSIESMAMVATLAGVCIATVNIIVEVLKSFWFKSDTSRPPAVLVVSILVAYFTVYAYCTIENVAFTPLLGIGTLAGGFFIAYGAMFGYDKLYGELFERLKKLIK